MQYQPSTSTENLPYFTYHFLKNLVTYPIDRIKLDLKAYANLIDRINGTKFDEEICLFWLQILGNLIDDKHSEISTNLLLTFLDSNIF